MFFLFLGTRPCDAEPGVFLSTSLSLSLLGHRQEQRHPAFAAIRVPALRIGGNGADHGHQTAASLDLSSVTPKTR